MQSAILLIDDEEDILDFLERILNTRYEVFKTENGTEALEILQRTSIQLIISDVMMPGMDGFELCRIVKSTPSLSHIPIILLTAKNTMQAKITGLELKADAYIEKPFSKEFLMAQIASLIANREMMLKHIAGSPLAHIKSITHSKEDLMFLKLLNEVICQNLDDEEMDVEKLARELNMTRITLYRRVKAISNHTPNELINMIKLQKAAEMLSEGNHKVFEIALMTGYKSQSNFARDFHRQFNISPTDFLETLKRKNPA